MISTNALRKEPGRRYSSAEQLAEDIDRHLTGRPVAARASSWSYRTGKHDERKARVLELRYFGGLSVVETAEVLGLSVATVGREARFATAWLRRKMLKTGA